MSEHQARPWQGHAELNGIRIDVGVVPAGLDAVRVIVQGQEPGEPEPRTLLDAMVRRGPSGDD